MAVLACALIVVAAACLAFGLVTGQVLLSWIALGVSVAGLALLVVVRWRAGAGAGDSEPSATVEPAAEPAAETAPVVESTLDVEPPTTASEPVVSEPAVQPVAAGPDTVRVIPGRLRYHRPDCRLLVDHEVEEIALEEAVEEGFTACTACTPTRSSSRPLATSG